MLRRKYDRTLRADEEREHRRALVRLGAKKYDASMAEDSHADIQRDRETAKKTGKPVTGYGLSPEERAKIEELIRRDATRAQTRSASMPSGYAAEYFAKAKADVLGDMRKRMEEQGHKHSAAASDEKDMHESLFRELERQREEREALRKQRTQERERARQEREARERQHKEELERQKQAKEAAKERAAELERRRAQEMEKEIDRLKAMTEMELRE
eukprot:Sspe_Gene.7815::Locus_2647_Transcript_1_1_Confidence_1.000_Length_871::g.7815::m.7815